MEIILAAVLLAFGILTIYFTIESRARDPKLMLILVLGAICIIAGSWILISSLTLGLILKKLAGLGLIGFGLFMVIGFPDVTDYQRAGVGKAGVFLGLVVLIIGFYLLLT
jgi:uncharacterized membrane protein HdeD (DUF308 family)